LPPKVTLDFQDTPLAPVAGFVDVAGNNLTGALVDELEVLHLHVDFLHEPFHIMRAFPVKITLLTRRQFY
jgi:hypothetical protein